VRHAAVLVLVVVLGGCAARAASFPAEPTAGSVYRALHLPAGAGPFPAVVLLHTCAGIQPHIDEWARRLTAAGYAAMVVDSFTPRGAKIVCGNWAVGVGEVTADAFAALARLRARSDIDARRVAVMGFSYGAMAALRTASASTRRASLGAAPGFAASVALYPYCTPILLSEQIPPHVRERLTNLQNDVDTPLLILIGGADDETPARQCVEPAEQLARAGRPVTIKVYPGVTHAFDQSNLPAAGYRTAGGSLYRYDRAATEDAATTSVRFLEARMRR
jgi:dienelactone hydrolase